MESKRLCTKYLFSIVLNTACIFDPAVNDFGMWYWENSRSMWFKVKVKLGRELFIDFD